MLWFADNKGLATGIAVAGFGLAKAIASPLMDISSARLAWSACSSSSPRSTR